MVTCAGWSPRRQCVRRSRNGRQGSGRREVEAADVVRDAGVQHPHRGSFDGDADRLRAAEGARSVTRRPVG